MLDNDEDLANIRAEYDTIIAFSVTKWIHLNFGDQGLKPVSYTHLDVYKRQTVRC